MQKDNCATSSLFEASQGSKYHWFADHSLHQTSTERRKSIDCERVAAQSSATRGSVDSTDKVYFYRFVILNDRADILCDFRRALAEADWWISFDRSGYGNQQEDANPLITKAKRHDQVSFLNLDYVLYFMIWLETQIFSDERISQLIRIFW